MAYAGHVTARTLAAKAIVAFTTSGATARRVACHRPVIPILALSIHEETKRRMALSWGVESAVTEIISNTDHMARIGVEQAQACGAAEPSDIIVVIAGTPPYGRSGRTNTLKVQKIPEVEAVSEEVGCD
jgi:pyruvate kinase